MTTASRLQLSLSAKGLTNLSGMLQTSDPFAIVTVRGDDPDNTPAIAGYTNVVYNNLNPDWSTVILLDGYTFGVPCFIEVGVFDFHAKHTGQKETDLAEQSSVTSAIINHDVAEKIQKHKKFPHKVMGTAFFEVGEVLGSRGNVASKALQTGGEVFVHIERSKGDCNMDMFRLKLGGLDLVDPGTMVNRTSSPFFEIFRRVERPTGGVSWNSVFRSNVARSDLNPLWGEALLPMEILCNGDLDRVVKIVVWAHRRSGKHKSMGAFKTTVRGLMEARTFLANPKEFFSLKETDDLTVAGIVGLEAEESSGSIVVLEAEILGSEKPKRSERPSLPQNTAFTGRPQFVDYLTGGCKIGLAVAVDLTASNGNTGKPDSLHYTNRDGFNDYEKAIVAVGSILAKYDSDQKFPVWGFGAIHNGTESHCFQCGENEEEHGVKGILDAYRSVFLSPFQMSSQTVFTEVIRTAAGYATHQQAKAEEEGNQSYTILLILTAGNVKNVRETKFELKAASQAPLSVVIVGIGEDKDFSGMEFLDGDHDPAADADITQFVRFSDYSTYNALTEAVLDEIPDQLVDYYYEKGIMPGKAENYDADNVRVQAADGKDRIANFLG